MKVTVFCCREFDERALFEKYGKEFSIELTLISEPPTMENIDLAVGSQCVNILTTPMTRELLTKLKEMGVRYVTTRTIGYDHIDMAAAKELGITVANAPYGPNGVADYTVMLMLMSIRKMKRIIERTNIQDYTLRGIQGRELKNMTVGIIGTGRIGTAVLQNLSGFGCKLLAYDINENDEAKPHAAYVPLQKLMAEADIISLHMPLLSDNFHMLDAAAFSGMKDGVIIINTARGGLIDSKALIAGIENGKIGAAGLDVVEDEFALYYYDRKSDALPNRELAILRGFPNVTVTHHMAFYTEECVTCVVKDSLQGCLLFAQGKENPWEVL